MRKYIIVSLLLILTISCEKYLTLYPEAQANAGLFYKTKSDFNAAVLACYASLRSYPTMMFNLVEYRSDNMFIKSYTSGSQELYQINKFGDNSSSSITSGAWADLYSTIFKCNQVISKIDDADIDATIKGQYGSEARFIRALCYFNLVRFFGDLPLVERPIETIDAMTVSRSKIDVIYKFIEDDLMKAMLSLPESYSDADLGRVRASAAKVLLAKVYMTENKFAQAEPILKTIIDANTYSLQSDITKVFAITSEMSSEVIFAIRFSKTLLGGGHGAWFSLSDVSISEISASLSGAYAIADARLNLIKYTKNGSVYYINKFIDTPDATTKNLSNDYIVLRYADVLLMYAECLNENLALSTDPASGALYYLNLVRKRSFATGAILPSQYANKNELRNIILKERWLEFPLEGNRWFDLVRTNTAKSQILANSGSGSPAGLLAPLAIVSDIPNFRLIYPVPNAEVEKINNKDIFPQNIGY